MQRLRALALPVELTYIALIPFAGAVASFALGERHAGWIIWGGWLLAVLNIFVQIPAALAEHKRAQAAQGWTKGRWWLSILAHALIAWRVWSSDQSLWMFFLEAAVLEAVALMGGFIVCFVALRGITGERAWTGMGVIPVLLICALFFGAGGGLFFAWWDQPRGPGWAVWLPLVLAFASAVFHKTLLLRDMRDGAFNPDALFITHIWLIIAPIFLWLIALPITRELLR